jgi:hypothetical protein
MQLPSNPRFDEKLPAGVTLDARGFTPPGPGGIILQVRSAMAVQVSAPDHEEPDYAAAACRGDLRT